MPRTVWFDAHIYTAKHVKIYPTGEAGFRPIVARQRFEIFRGRIMPLQIIAERLPLVMVHGLLPWLNDFPAAVTMYRLCNLYTSVPPCIICLWPGAKVGTENYLFDNFAGRIFYNYLVCHLFSGLIVFG